jgi:hypothetical protein
MELNVTVAIDAIDGESFLRASAGQQDSCAIESNKNLDRLAENVQRIVELIGQLLYPRTGSLVASGDAMAGNT